MLSRGASVRSLNIGEGSSIVSLGCAGGVSGVESVGVDCLFFCVLL